MDSFFARGENVKLGKGALFLDIDGDGYEFIGNANSIAMSADVTTAELFSSTEEAGSIVDRTRTRIRYTVTPSINEYTLRNLQLFLAGELGTKNQSSNATDTFNISDVVQGRYYDVGARQITGVSVTKGSDALTEGTDYEVNGEFGVVHIFASAPGVADGDDLVVHFSTPAKAIKQVNIAVSGQITAKLLYLADDANNSANPAKDRLELWKVDIQPDGELNLISDDYGAFSLQMTVLGDSTNHPTQPYGTLDRIAAAF